MINLKKNNIGFTKNENKNNSILYLVKDLDELVKIKLLKKDEISLFLKNFKRETERELSILPNLKNNSLLATAILIPSKVHRKSTIDKAAKIAQIIDNKIWNIHFSSSFSNEEIYDFLLGWGLSFYKFSIRNITTQMKYLNLNSIKNFPTKMINKCKNEIKGFFLARNLINLPANYLNPEEYEKKILNIFFDKDIKTKVFKGTKFEKMFPLIHVVGRSSEFQPRLIEINWKYKSSSKIPTIIIIGKGITFDTGGLDLKPSFSMLQMKKDMAGSAIAISLARTLISERFKINLKLLLPIAENAVSQKSMRPMDIVFSRNKTPIEIGNTDAEGRLILADALTYSQESKIKPNLIIDLATLTGAARVALGTEMPAFFSNNKKITEILLKNSFKSVDPLWELPLFSSYKRHLKNENGTLSSTGFSGTGGAITAALFLQNFLESNINWIHLDLMGWNLQGRPGFPKGGEAMGFRAILQTIQDFYNK